MARRIIGVPPGATGRHPSAGQAGEGGNVSPSTTDDARAVWLAANRLLALGIHPKAFHYFFRNAWQGEWGSREALFPGARRANERTDAMNAIQRRSRPIIPAGP